MNIYIVTSLLTLWVTCSSAALNPQVVYSWAAMDYDWPSDAIKQNYVNNGKYVLASNVPSGIKIYKDEVYLTVPRSRAGVPSTMNKIIQKNGKYVLQPYPGWKENTLGDCNAMQYVQSMEIDPNTGYMWIIDNGRTEVMSATANNKCPPKLIIWDINKRIEVRRYVFPSNVASHTNCFLNDIALDYVNGDAKFAYITDSNDAKLYVYDLDRNRAFYYMDSSMNASLPGGRLPINGLAVSHCSKYLYFCPVDGYDIFQIPTSVIRQPNRDFHGNVRSVGQRQAKTGGITYGQRSLFYGMVYDNGVHRWNVDRDVINGDYARVTLKSDDLLVRDDVNMRWVDSFAWDNKGSLWFTTNDLTKFLDGTMDLSGKSGVNFRVWKMFVNETSYLTDRADCSRVQSVG